MLLLNTGLHAAKAVKFCYQVVRDDWHLMDWNFTDWGSMNVMYGTVPAVMNDRCYAEW